MALRKINIKSPDEEMNFFRGSVCSERDTQTQPSQQELRADIQSIYKFRFYYFFLLDCSNSSFYYFAIIIVVFLYKCIKIHMLSFLLIFFSIISYHVMWIDMYDHHPIRTIYNNGKMAACCSKKKLSRRNKIKDCVCTVIWNWTGWWYTIHHK